MLGEAIRIARSFIGMSQKELASAMDVSNGYISQLEAGDKEPSQKTLRKAASALGVPVSSLVFFAEQLSEDEGETEAEARKRFGRKVLQALSFIEEKAK